VILILQILAMIAAIFLLNLKYYFLIGLITAVVVFISEFRMWIRTIEDKIGSMELDSVDTKTAIRVSLLVTSFFNLIISVWAWPAVMMTKFIAGFASTENKA